MHLPISLCLTKPSLWTITSGRKKTEGGSLAATRPTLMSLTRSIILLREVEAIVPIAMELTSIGEIATTIMATRLMATTGTTTLEETAMDITMAIAMDITMAIAMDTPMGKTDSI